MKIHLLMLGTVLTISCANAQKIKEAEVPSKVKEAFAAKYPSVKVEKWEKENGNYEAEFDMNKVETSALFDINGTFKEVEQEIKTSEFPKTVSEYCAKNFAGYTLKEASKITDASGTVTYEAEMKNGKEHFDALFDKNGKFLRKGDVKTGGEDRD